MSLWSGHHSCMFHNTVEGYRQLNSVYFHNLLRCLRTHNLQSNQQLPSTVFDMQLCGQPWRSTSAPINLIWVIKNLCDKATSAILFNSSIGDWFRTTVGVRQGCLLSPTLFDIFLERIMTDVLEDHGRTVSIGGRKITNFCSADNIDGLAGEEELAK